MISQRFSVEIIENNILNDNFYINNKMNFFDKNRY
jgi:hypothetical protein